MMSVITCEGTYKHEEYARSYNSPTKMALPNFPIDKAYLIGDWLAAVLWGKYLHVLIYRLTPRTHAQTCRGIYDTLYPMGCLDD